MRRNLWVEALKYIAKVRHTVDAVVVKLKDKVEEEKMLTPEEAFQVREQHGGRRNSRLGQHCSCLSPR